MAIKIGKDTFVVPQPDGIRTFCFQQEIVPVAANLAAAIAVVVGKADITSLKDILDSDILDSLPIALPRLGHVFGAMKPGELERLMRTLLNDPKTGAPADKVATMNNAPLFSAGGDAFGEFLKGRHLDIWRLLAHAMEVWYPDFFGLAQSWRARGKKEKGSEESSTSPQPGPSSVSS